MIKDPIYGMISLSETEQRIIDTPAFQRLRRIKHLGLAYLVYPGAMHTRFEHSLGTMHIAGQICKAVGVEPEVPRLYALLHDLGHGPFSHTSEQALWEIGKKTTHEALLWKRINESEIKDILTENHTLHELKKRDKTKEIIHGAIGADRIDYLKRDSWATGVAYGIIDDDRLISEIEFDGKALYILEGGLEAAESLLIARFMMFTTVYLHHTVRISTLMLREAIKAALAEGLDWREMMAMDDEELWVELKHHRKSNYWIKRLRERKLLKRLAEVEKLEQDQVELLKNEGLFVDPPALFVREDPLTVKLKSGKLVPCTTASSLIKDLKIAAQQRARYLVIGKKEQKKQVEKLLKR